MNNIEIIQTFALVIIILILLKQYSVKTLPKKSTNSVVLDTSAIIDGRIIDIAHAGFMPGMMIVPQFIVRELQLLADGNDSHKRERARFGLDVVARLQAELSDQVILEKTDFLDKKATDDKLVQLAVDKKAFLCTNDFNLNKVAVTERVRVLNINQLAQAVRPVALPGENHRLKIVQKGSSKDQGVGYLEDGTMVVIGNASNMIGKTVDVSVTRMLQTEAGKMMFAVVKKDNPKPK